MKESLVGHWTQALAGMGSTSLCPLLGQTTCQEGPGRKAISTAAARQAKRCLRWTSENSAKQESNDQRSIERRSVVSGQRDSVWEDISPSYPVTAHNISVPSSELAGWAHTGLSFTNSGYGVDGLYCLAGLGAQPAWHGL